MNKNTNRHHLLTSEFFRYFAISLIALLVDLAFFSFALRWVGLPWVVAAGLGFAVGVLTAWYLSISFVFKNRTLYRKPAAEFLSFLAIGIAGLGVTEFVLFLGIEQFGVLPEISKLVAAGLTFLFNFSLRKLLLFRKDPKKSLTQQSLICKNR